MVVTSAGHVLAFALPELPELDDYLGNRASRGGLLPRGWQKVDALAVE